MTTAARGTRAEAEDDGAAVQMPQFLQPQPLRQDSPAPDLTTVHPQETPQESRGGHPENDALAADDEPAATMAAGPSPASTGKPLRPLATAAQVAGAKSIMSAVLMGATALVNRRTRVDEHDDRWLMEPDELDATATPFARMLARRSPLPSSGDDASDVADMIEGVVSLISFTIRQMLTERRPSGVTYAAATDEQPAPAGPGATLSPLDPAYRMG